MSFENNFISFSFGKIQTELINGVEKKRLPDLPYWKSISETQIKPAHKSRATRTGKISGITVIDFDDKKVYKKLLEEHPDLNECYTV